MTTRQLGEEGFRWFLGVVEDRNDPLMLGRVRVRILNLHSEKKSRVNTDELPWATILNDPTSSSFDKVGRSPTGIQVGSTVVGFFIDGKDGNSPVVMGTLYGIREIDANKHDVPPEAREINSVVKDQVGPEPPSAYGTKYPYNKVVRTEGGHVIEVDDTPGRERIHLYHKSGTYVEINESGRMVTKVVDNDYEIVVKNKEVYVRGNVHVKVDGTYTVESSGNMTFKAPRIDLNP